MSGNFTIIDAVNDKNVFKPFFKRDTWQPWLAFLCALFALPMTPEQLALYQKFTGRTTPPSAPLTEAWLCIGRRGGKSFILATIAVFLACFKDWRPYLAPGEVGTVMIIARDRRQGRVIKRYISGLIREVPMLKAVLIDETAETINLKNRVSIEIHTASFRSTRGYTIVAALCDEIAFWPTDETSSEPDAEVINAIKPGMATIPGAMLLAASSPYARKGAMWEAYRKHFAKDGDDVLVWRADTRSMNAGVPQKYIDAQYADDPARAAAEYGGLFRVDLEAFVLREAVEACVAVGERERSPRRDVAYTAFCDPSGGSQDSMTLAIGHIDHNRETIVIDCLREAKAPFSPEIVTSEFCALLSLYGLNQVTSDRYGGAWVTEQFAKFGVICTPAEKPKSLLYIDLLPCVNSRRIDLPDNTRMINQLLALERRTGRGADIIDHPVGGCDDLINAVAGVCSICITKGVFNLNALAGTKANTDDPYNLEDWRRSRRNAYILSGGLLKLW